MTKAIEPYKKKLNTNCFLPFITGFRKGSGKSSYLDCECIPGIANKLGIGFDKVTCGYPKNSCQRSNGEGYKACAPYGDCIQYPFSDDYVCSCDDNHAQDPSFTGTKDNCLMKMTSCAFKICVYGKCIDGENRVGFCVCDEGYIGEFCHTRQPMWTLWSPWSPCKPSCGPIRSKERTRHCGSNKTAEEGLDSKRCMSQTESLTEDELIAARFEIKPCSASACFLDGEAGEWESWSKCNQTCDTGFKYRRRDCFMNYTVFKQDHINKHLNPFLRKFFLNYFNKFKPKFIYTSGTCSEEEHSEYPNDGKIGECSLESMETMIIPDKIKRMVKSYFATKCLKATKEIAYCNRCPCDYVPGKKSCEDLIKERTSVWKLWKPKVQEKIEYESPEEVSIVKDLDFFGSPLSPQCIFILSVSLLISFCHIALVSCFCFVVKSTLNTHVFNIKSSMRRRQSKSLNRLIRASQALK